MRMKFDHIGIFVKKIEIGRDILESLLPIVRQSEVHNDPGMGIQVQFLYDEDNICYEIVAPNGENNPVDPILNSRRNILNHIAYRVDDFEGELNRMRASGCLPLGQPQPALAFNGACVAFFLSPLNFIIELIENK